MIEELEEDKRQDREPREAMEWYHSKSNLGERRQDKGGEGEDQSSSGRKLTVY